MQRVLHRPPHLEAPARVDLRTQMVLTGGASIDLLVLACLISPCTERQDFILVASEDEEIFYSKQEGGAEVL